MALVKRITRLEDGNPTVLFKEKKRKRKVSRWLKPLDKATRRMLRANQTFADVYLERYDRSNRKKRNGAARDHARNVFRAQRKAAKKLRLT